MSASLELKNYRGYKDYRVEQLAQVNLFLGKNNVGKTSLLEAAQILHAPSPLLALRSIAVRRSEISVSPPDPYAPERFSRRPIEINHAFNGHTISAESVIEISGDGVQSVGFEIDQSGERQSSLDLGWEEEPTTFTLLSKRGGQVLEVVSINDAGVWLDDPRPRAHSRLSQTYDRTLFISPESLPAGMLYRLYNEVITSASEALVVQALQLLDESVNGVYFLASERSSTSSGNAGILIGRNDDVRLPIGSFGDGMRRLLALAMALVNTRGGALLIDEVDTGLHYSVMPDLWKLILGTTRELDTRSYFTTHSLDCVRGLWVALQAFPEFATQIAVHKIDGRLNKAVSFTGDELMRALDYDLELR